MNFITSHRRGREAERDAEQRFEYCKKRIQVKYLSVPLRLCDSAVKIDLCIFTRNPQL